MQKQDTLVELLKEVRVKMQNDLEDSVVSQLDELILELEEVDIAEQDPKAKQKALELLGKCLKYLPFIVELIRALLD